MLECCWGGGEGRSEKLHVPSQAGTFFIGSINNPDQGELKSFSLFPCLLQFLLSLLLISGDTEQREFSLFPPWFQGDQQEINLPGLGSEFPWEELTALASEE